MGIKSNIKKAIGPANLARVKHGKAWMKYLKSRKPGHPDYFTLRSEDWEEPQVFSLPAKHVFFGYYDIQQLNSEQDKMLVTVIPQNADTQKDKAQLQWVDLITGEYHPVAETSAWCWQQGARFRWHPAKKNTVLYNDVADGHYTTCVYDLDKKEKVASYPRAMYDVTPDFRYGLSLNYSRLQRLRPGYGYNTLPDNTINEKVPKNDGIYLVDLNSSETKLILSYEQLVELSPEAKEEWNYINHISISPDGSRFMFFHLWTPGIGARWKAKLYTAKMDGSELQCLESEYITSHYCWRNSNELLTTSVGFGGTRTYYFAYNIAEGTRKVVESPHLQNDGHPTYMADKMHFIADTYPLKDCMQHVFLESIDGEGYEPICDLFSDPRMFEEKRCDLHPRLTMDNKIFTIDSTFEHGTRSVLLLKHK